jgi:hypothetical protein
MARVLVRRGSWWGILVVVVVLVGSGIDLTANVAFAMAADGTGLAVGPRSRSVSRCARPTGDATGPSLAPAWRRESPIPTGSPTSRARSTAASLATPGSRRRWTADGGGTRCSPRKTRSSGSPSRAHRRASPRGRMSCSRRATVGNGGLWPRSRRRSRACRSPGKSASPSPVVARAPSCSRRPTLGEAGVVSRWRRGSSVLISCRRRGGRGNLCFTSAADGWALVRGRGTRRRASSSGPVRRGPGRRVGRVLWSGRPGELFAGSLGRRGVRDAGAGWRSLGPLPVDR